MYKHTQIGWVTILSLGIALIVVNAMFSAAQSSGDFFISLVLLTAIPVFATLTISIKDCILHVVFGIGLIRIRIKFDDIRSSEIVRNKWWYGYGIHGWFKKGWLINVSGLDAVELRMKNGMLYRIGTDEPQKLHEAIQSKLNALNQ